MTAKEYLSQAYRIDQRINNKMEQITSLRDLLFKTHITMSDMPGNPNRDSSRVEKYLVKIYDLERELDNEIDRLVSLKTEIKHAIDAVGDTDCKVLLEERYMFFRSWEEIACRMGYTVRNVHRLHSKALGMVNVVTKCH